MTRTSVPLRRIAALSVVITLFTAPIASAQTPAPPSTGDAPATTALLSPAAFSRLVQQPRTEVAAVPVAKDSHRPSLLRQGTTAMARQTQTAPTKAPQRSWVARHKVATGILIGVGAAVGMLFIAYGAGWGDWGD